MQNEHLYGLQSLNMKSLAKNLQYDLPVDTGWAWVVAFGKFTTANFL